MAASTDIGRVSAGREALEQVNKANGRVQVRSAELGIGAAKQSP